MRDACGDCPERGELETASTSALATLHTITRSVDVGMGGLSPEFCTITVFRRDSMRAHLFCTIFTLVSSAAVAQQPAAATPPPPAKLFAGSADVTAMIA